MHDQGKTLLHPADRLVLRAATRSDDSAVVAFLQWRKLVKLDDISFGAYKAMPLLIDLIKRYGLHDPDIERMKGVDRYFWTSNILQLRQLFSALDALAQAEIKAVLLKGAALFARDFQSARKRVAGDCDLLVEPGSIGRARAALEQRGFAPKGFVWMDFDTALPGSTTAGAPIALAGQHGELDLHWRPLPQIFDVKLTERIFSMAEEATLDVRRVRIPATAHHLFLAMARCEAWDKTECFSRVMEGYFLLTGGSTSLDWSEFEALVIQYGLALPAELYLSTLADECGLEIPLDLVARLASAKTRSGRRDWRIRNISPTSRTPWQERQLAKHDVSFGRANDAMSVPTLTEVFLRQWGTGHGTLLTALWRLAAARFEGSTTGQLHFLEGFSFPEANGRWTNSRWAFCAVPLTDAQRHGALLRLNGHVFRGTRLQSRVIVTGGSGVFRTSLSGDAMMPEIALKARPLARLGGDALILFWLPDAMSPAEAGESQDSRLLGLFLRRDWRGSVPSSQDVAPQR